MRPKMINAAIKLMEKSKTFLRIYIPAYRHVRTRTSICETLLELFNQITDRAAPDNKVN